MDLKIILDSLQSSNEAMGCKSIPWANKCEKDNKK